MAKITEITAETLGQEGVDEFLDRARAENKFALLTHSIEGCGPCIQLGRLLKKLAVDFEDTVLFGKMMVEDTLENEAYSQKHDFEGYISTIPMENSCVMTYPSIHLSK